MLNQGSGFSSSNKPSQSQSHELSKQAAEPWPPSGCLYHLLCRVYCSCWLSATCLQPSARSFAAKTASSSDQCQMAEPQEPHYPDDCYRRVNQVDSTIRQFKTGYLKATLAAYASFSGGDARKLFPHQGVKQHNARSGSETFSHPQLPYTLAMRFWESRFHSGQISKL